MRYSQILQNFVPLDESGYLPTQSILSYVPRLGINNVRMLSIVCEPTKTLIIALTKALGLEFGIELREWAQSTGCFLKS